MDTLKPQFTIGTVVNHAHYGPGRIVGYDTQFYVVLFKGETRNVPFDYKEMKGVEATGDAQLDLVKTAIREVLGDYGWIDTNLELGKRWIGGTLRLLPGKEETQPKDIPIEAFFKKIVGVREKLRVLEQKINNHAVLDVGDKAELQGYITRCYGSLTTFNALFADSSGQFKGSGGTTESVS